MTDTERVFKLRCAYQTFIWGKKGKTSLVAELLKNAAGTQDIDPGTAYSELWMGTHCLGNSCIIRSDGTEEGLDTWIEKHPDSLSVQNGVQCNGRLPFMFKVLSIGKTLSLQAHPDKLLAAELHLKNPDVYKDGNHKPEMAIAINNFRALVGFKSIRDIAKHCLEIDELRQIVGRDNSENVIAAANMSDEQAHRDALKACFEEAFMDDSNNKKLDLLDRLVAKVQLLLDSGRDVTRYEGHTLLKIAREYPRDMGALAVYFLNEVRLQPGEALFVDVNEPHAYLQGDCLECLTCSHNVVRFGLTHKLKDIDNLRRMLTYKSTTPEEVTLKCERHENNGCHVTRYLPPISEFAVSRIELPGKFHQFRLNSLNTASILLCMEGSGSIRTDTTCHSMTIQDVDDHKIPIQNGDSQRIPIQNGDDHIPIQDGGDHSIPIQDGDDHKIPIQNCDDHISIQNGDDHIPIQDGDDHKIPIQNCDDHIPIQNGDDHIPIQDGDDHKIPIHNGDDHIPIQDGDDHIPIQDGDDHKIPIHNGDDHIPIQDGGDHRIPIQDGDAHIIPIQRGTAVFVSAGETITISKTHSHSLVLFRAYSRLK